MKPNRRIELASRSVLGVSIGDAFGESFFGKTEIIEATYMFSKLFKQINFHIQLYSNRIEITNLNTGESAIQTAI